MSHEAHQDTHHVSDNSKSKIAFKSSFWFVIILVGLFIAALNFIGAMSSGEEGGKAEKTETAVPEAGAAVQPSDNGHTEVPPANTAGTTDSAKH
jgi:hypothetical protein